MSVIIQQPQYIHSILTLGTKFDWTAESAQHEVRFLNPEKILEKVPAFAQYLNALHRPESWQTLMTKTADMMLDLGNGSRIDESEFEQILLKVCIGRGGEDTMVSEAESKRICSILPNATYMELEGVQHPIDKIPAKILVDCIVKAFPI